MQGPEAGTGYCVCVLQGVAWVSCLLDVATRQLVARPALKKRQEGSSKEVASRKGITKMADPKKS